MIYAPFTLLLLLLLVALLAVFVVLVEMRVMNYAYRKVGVRPRYAFAVMLVSLLGSAVNIPPYSVPTRRLVSPHEVSMFGRTYIVPETLEEGATLVALNVGGALIPILVSIYLLLRTRMYGRMLIGVALVAAVVHSLAHIVPGIGIAVPMIAPPLVAAAVGPVLSFRGAPPIASVAWSLCTVICGFLLDLPDA